MDNLKGMFKFILAVLIISVVIYINYLTYQAIPDDSKWLFWLLRR